MDKRQLAATLFEKTGVKLTEDDPAFLLVDLNLLVLESERGKAAKDLNQATDQFQAVTTRSIDDFVSVANEALSKFITRTNEIKTALDAVNAQGAVPIVAPALPQPVAPAVPAKPRPAALWLLPVLYAAGVVSGVLLSFLLLKQ